MPRNLSAQEAREIIERYRRQYDLYIHEAPSGRFYLATMSESLFDPAWVLIGGNCFAAAHTLIAAWYDLHFDTARAVDHLPPLTRPGFTPIKEIGPCE